MLSPLAVAALPEGVTQGIPNQSWFPLPHYPDVPAASVPSLTPFPCIPDQNECAAMKSPCSHACHNSVGSFSCSCPAGYALAPDGKECRGKEGAALSSLSSPSSPPLARSPRGAAGPGQGHRGATWSEHKQFSLRTCSIRACEPSQKDLHKPVSEGGEALSAFSRERGRPLSLGCRQGISLGAAGACGNIRGLGTGTHAGLALGAPCGT